ncbi:MAG: AAA family ATPase, partial [Egibacteraceae bacterium]
MTNWLAHQLREAKTREAAPTQRGRWTAEAAGRGWDVRALFDRMRGQVRTQQQLGPDERQAIFDRLASPTGLTGQASTFTRGHVLRAIGDQVGTLPVAEIETLADRFLSERAVQLLTDPRTGAWRYSTPELLKLERGIVEQAAARQDEDRHVVPYQVVQAVVDRYETFGKPLGEDQAEVVRSVCAGGAGVCLVVGRAGTGKTFTMDAVRTAFQTANLLLPERQRMTVRGLAPTGVAALELDAGAGIRSLTVDRFLCDLAQGRDRLSAADVLVVDEANMLGTRKFARLFDHANQVGAKLIAVG